MSEASKKRYNVDKTDTLLIWDAEGIPPVGDWSAVLWSDYANTNESCVISIPVLVEEQADVLRSRYLAWIYDLGETRIKGKRVVDHLELRPGLSYWWMTSLAQKFNAADNSQINNVIKAFVLISLISEHQSTSIILRSNNAKLARTLQHFCRNSQLQFKWESVNKASKQISFVRGAYGSLPYPLQAFISLSRYFFKAFSLFRIKQKTATLHGDLCFIDVLVHLDRKAYASQCFISNYWTTLVDKLTLSNIKTNWLHNYFYQKSIPSPVRAKELLGNFNKCASEIQSHVLVEENLSISIILKTLRDYLRTSIASLCLSEVAVITMPDGLSLNLWPLIKDEWINSVRGPSAIFNCLRISLYEKTFSDIPHQKTGVYIQENQPWEMALNYAWKNTGHGQIIGVPHTTVRYWDLRYFYDPRSYDRIGTNLLQIPDLVAVNGPEAKKVYLKGKYPESLVIEVEALRFLHLLNSTNSTLPRKPPSKVLRILICGDFLSSTSEKMLSWLTIAAKSLPSETQYTLKPHPAYPVDVCKFPSITLKITDAPLTNLFMDCDVVFTSNITSAALDAYCSGIPVIQMLDGTTFNMSPLRGLKGGVYVRNPNELTKALYNSQYCERVEAEPYFYLDEELPRWKELLDMNSEVVIND